MSLDDFSRREIRIAWKKGILLANRLVRAGGRINLEAEDLVQEVFHKLHSGQRSMNIDERSLEKHVLYAVKSTYLNLRKKEKAELEKLAILHNTKIALFEGSIGAVNPESYQDIEVRDFTEKLEDWVASSNDTQALQLFREFLSENESPRDNAHLAIALNVSPSDVVNAKKRLKRIVEKFIAFETTSGRAS